MVFFMIKIATLEPLLTKGYQTISPLVSNFIAESTNFKAEKQNLPICIPNTVDQAHTCQYMVMPPTVEFLLDF
jgi:hypothetical protein